MRRAIGIGLILFYCGLTAAAQSTNAGASYHRPADASDIAGLWKVVKWTAYFPILEKDRLNPFYRDYQWYLYGKDGSLKSLSSTRDSNAKDVLKALKTAPDVVRYDLDKNVLRTTRSDLPDRKETWSCSMIVEEKHDFSKNVALNKGDLVMSLLNRDGKVVYVRQLRKLSPATGKKAE
jgi:hypothetical protein